MARVTLEVFACEIIRALLDLITILNHCHHHREFVYQHARFGPDKKSVAVNVRPRAGSAAVCSGCHQPAPGYDHLPERRFEFIPCWGTLVFFLTVCGASNAATVAWWWSRKFLGARASTS